MAGGRVTGPRAIAGRAGVYAAVAGQAEPLQMVSSAFRQVITYVRRIVSVRRAIGRIWLQLKHILAAVIRHLSVGYPATAQVFQVPVVGVAVGIVAAYAAEGVRTGAAGSGILAILQVVAVRRLKRRISAGRVTVKATRGPVRGLSTHRRNAVHVDGPIAVVALHADRGDVRTPQQVRDACHRCSSPKDAALVVRVSMTRGRVGYMALVALQSTAGVIVTSHRACAKYPKETDRENRYYRQLHSYPKPPGERPSQSGLHS